MARLDERGATYAKVHDHPGWFVAEWYEPDYPTPDGRPWRWAVHADHGRGQKIYVREFARRASAREARS